MTGTLKAYNSEMMAAAKAQVRITELQIFLDKLSCFTFVFPGCTCFAFSPML